MCLFKRNQFSGACRSSPRNGSLPRKMPTRDQVKALISDPRVQDRIIDMLDELLKMTEKPGCPPWVPVQYCDKFLKGELPVPKFG